MNVCKDKCRHEKPRGTRDLYKNGYKRCTICDKAIKNHNNEIYCYCCGSHYRNGAQAGIHRKIRIESYARID